MTSAFHRIRYELEQVMLNSLIISLVGDVAVLTTAAALDIGRSNVPVSPKIIVLCPLMTGFPLRCLCSTICINVCEQFFKETKQNAWGVTSPTGMEQASALMLT